MSLLPSGERARRILSWSVVGFGVLLSLYLLGIASAGRIAGRVTSVGGINLMGMAFAAASFVAMRNRRSAGLILLVSAPFVAFLLSYSHVQYYIWVPEGYRVYRVPELSTTVGLTCLFYLPFVAPLFFMRHRRRALSVFLISAAGTAYVFFDSPWTASLLPQLASWTPVFAVFGGFWLLTAQQGWPVLHPHKPRSVTKRVVTVLLQCLALMVVAVILSLSSTIAGSSWEKHPSGEGPGVHVESNGPDDAAFTARLVWVGHSAKVNGRWAGDWAVGVVQENFWGLLPWARHLVLLSNGLFWEGQTVLVCGQRQDGAISRYMPVIEALYVWTSTDAKPRLRLLRQPLRPGEFRIMGFIRSPLPPRAVPKPKERSDRKVELNDIYELWFNPPETYRPLTGARILVIGTSGTTVISTDSDGMYELAGLRPDDYAVKILDLPPNQTHRELRIRKEEMAGMGAVQWDIRTEWVGIIEGSVRESGGGPARVSVNLENVDGESLSDGNLSSCAGEKDGSFHFPHLPAGNRYVLVINRDGQSDYSPYARMYYPAATRREDAQVFKIGDPKQFRDVRVIVKRAVRRGM